MTKEDQKNYFELFPNTFVDSEIEAIAEFRNYIKDEFQQEVNKFKPDHSLLRKGFWPFYKDKNQGKLLEQVNDMYLTIILATSIYCDYALEEYDEFLVKSLVGEIITRKPYLMHQMVGKTFPQIRDMLIASYRPTNKPSTKMLYIDGEWPLQSYYYGREIDKIPTKVLISTLAVNSYCCPGHQYFNKELTNWVITELERRMGDK